MVSHERERNWNAPHPKWTHTPRRSISPLPQITPSPPQARAQTRPSPGARPRSQVIMPTRAQLPTTPRTRTQSLEASAMMTPPKEDLHATLRANGSPSPSPSSLGARRTSRDITKSPSPSPGSLRARPSSSYSTPAIHGELVDRTNRLSPRPRPSSYHASSSSLDQRPLRQLVPRPNSPIPSTTPEKPPPNGFGSTNGTPEGKESPSRGLSSHFGFRFPKNRTVLPPLDLGSDSPERHITPVSARSVSGPSIGGGKPSHIPVRSPGNIPKSSSSGSVGSNDRDGRSPSPSPTSSPTFQRGHKRTTTEFSEAAGTSPLSTTPPPMTPVIYVGDEEVELGEEVDMDLESEPEVQVGQWDGDHHDDDSVRGEWRITALFLDGLKMVQI